MPEPTILTEMILPDQANHYGTLFGGRGLSLMTRAAFVAASRHARRKVVLAACHEARFDAPVPMGSLFVLSASVTSVGRSSMKVRVSGTCERPEQGSSSPVAQATFTMVAVDDDGRPVPVSALEKTA
ncbi:MAG: acyl-CoA thioesterase [Paracoccus sp. (in: a-proteobacteria)]|uniref:acyl-CoA thioesterase n=1 Tax=Paracoccus sp. TaxID=267 RepID=UPI0026DFF610|nr:acyl-CoA thioesterase [Paracoccus sp. (in: a-proteobacteria)]MDO5622888.1 acyl-CoA thioesterase [Paracoccus sp. (in: a-proteobacteria)]